MMSEHFGPGAEKIVGVEVWGNKLCVPHHVTLDSPKDPRSVWKRIEDGLRAVVGRPRHLASSYSYHLPNRRETIRTFVEERGARVVATLRDPDQVVDSIRRRGNVSVDRGKDRWAQAVRIIHRTYQEYEDRVLLLHFSDLVGAPEPSMRAVCRLLELPFDEQMLSGHAHTPQYDNDSIDASKATREVPSYELEAHDAKAVDLYHQLTNIAREAIREPASDASAPNASSTAQ
jgi:hypothetical protein